MPTELKARTQQDLPIYQRIELDLRSRVERGEWNAGEMLPSRRDMATQYRVDVNTFQRAIMPLLSEGILRADAGRGTFVPSVEPSEDGGVLGSSAFRFASAMPYGKRSMANTTAGIITGYPPEDAWMPPVVNAFEVAFSGLSGKSKFFNLLRPNLPPGIDPWIPVPDAVKHLLDGGVDVIVLMSLYDRPNDLSDVQMALKGTNVHLVYVGWDDIRQPIDHVYYDNKIAGYQAAQHLIEFGYEQITFFSPISDRWVDERLEFAKRAGRDAGLPDGAVKMYHHDHFYSGYGDHFAEGYKAAKTAFAAGDIGNAVICANDRLALGLMRAADEAGLTPGVHFSVIGFDDEPMARIYGLTTLRPPLEQIGVEAARLVERAVAGEASAAQCRLSSQLLLRSSTIHANELASRP
ncbi:MAG TPA: GntR family transcriptional regulator [Capsulimonadaceae bacterium]